MTETHLSASERQRLCDLAGLMIPAEPALGMPAASDPLILADIERSIGRDLPAVHEALKSYRPGQEINDWYAGAGVPGQTLGRLVLAAYYRDDRVLVALGHEARAPFPKGYVVEQGDWSLLAPVKQRTAFWRRDR
ncbi:MAG TPA: hypothetical protein VFB13_12875 [Reyranella sp.]|jgi:hypothetical protein|nr:hypothetical protein [Reyranella sp.]